MYRCYLYKLFYCDNAIIVNVCYYCTCHKVTYNSFKMSHQNQYLNAFLVCCQYNKTHGKLVLVKKQRHYKLSHTSVNF